MGIFDFLYQILYSTIICAVINSILKLLSLSENNIIEIKKQINLKLAFYKSKSFKKYLKLKYIIFYIFSFLLLNSFYY